MTTPILFPVADRPHKVLKTNPLLSFPVVFRVLPVLGSVSSRGNYRFSGVRFKCHVFLILPNSDIDRRISASGGLSTLLPVSHCVISRPYSIGRRII
jgi:hypothetical protein